MQISSITVHSFTIRYWGVNETNPPRADVRNALRDLDVRLGLTSYPCRSRRLMFSPRCKGPVNWHEYLRVGGLALIATWASTHGTSLLTAPDVPYQSLATASRFGSLARESGQS